MTHDGSHSRWLFWTCFVALTATSFGFISRVFLLDDWAVAFDLSETQKGEIFGAGLWPFAISIVLFSLVVDWVGYGRAMWFAVIGQVASGIMTITATGYQSLYWAAFVGALGAGTIEAVINPVIASVFHREKTKWLNVLHAGWPAGLVVAGAATIFLGDWEWKLRAGLMFVPVVVYAVMLLRCPFPINERVAARVPYRDMLAEAGGVGIFIVSVLIIGELGRVMAASSGVETPWTWLIGGAAALSLAFGVGVRALGRPLYILMLLVMLLLATTELGTDGWIKELMRPAMDGLGLDSGWVLVYTALIMTVLRFMTGPILHRTGLTPLGLLATSCVAVIIGLVTLSGLGADGHAALILIAATVYGAGQCFFWPTTLGYISEQFPRGGALTLNAIAGVGMLGVGILGGPWLGFVQDTEIETKVRSADSALYDQIRSDATKESFFGKYRAIDETKTAALDVAQRAVLSSAKNDAKSSALLKVAALPAIMLVVYLLLIGWHRRRGGYSPKAILEPGTG